MGFLNYVKRQESCKCYFPIVGALKKLSPPRKNYLPAVQNIFQFEELNS